MDVGTPVTFMGRPLKVYNMAYNEYTANSASLQTLDSATAESLSLVEEIFNKTNFMNRQITFPGGKTILGSEVFDHVSAYHYFSNPSFLGSASAAYSAQELTNPLAQSLGLKIGANSILLGRHESGFLGANSIPVETKAQLTIHEIIHAAAHRSGAMPNDFTDQVEALQTGRGTVAQATLVGANEAFAESLSTQLMAEVGITDNLVASGYDTMREVIHLNQTTPFKEDISLATARGMQKQYLSRRSIHH